jgi:hypothetical protein
MPDPKQSSEDEKRLEEQRAARKAASRDEKLREQVKTETEERPYLDTEGSD